MTVHVAPPVPDLERLAQDISASIAAGDKAKEKSDQHYKSAGLKLIEAKKQIKNFDAFLAKYGLGSTRAYELIAIAEGRTTVEEVRAKSNERKKRHRDKKAEAAAVPPVASPSVAAPPASVPERTAPDKSAKALAKSAKALAEFKYAVDRYMPQMDAEAKQQAVAYAEFHANATQPSEQTDSDLHRRDEIRTASQQRKEIPCLAS